LLYKVTKGEYSVGMDDNRAVHRLEMRITTKQKDRLLALMERHEAKKANIVNDAIKEKFERDIGELPAKGTKKKK
jgi:hypothetical protein